MGRVVITSNVRASGYLLDNIRETKPPQHIQMHKNKKNNAFMAVLSLNHGVATNKCTYFYKVQRSITYNLYINPLCTSWYILSV